MGLGNMEIVDFSFVVDNDIHYGGDAGSKLGFVWNEENWFLKQRGHIGNSFNNKGSDEKFVRIMQSEDALLNSVILFKEKNM